MTAKLNPNENAADALLLIARWGKLRPQELGRMLYKNEKHARKYAEGNCRKLLALNFLIARKLPGGVATGTAYVISEAGARWLANTHGRGFKSGKDWGTTYDGEWNPPACWKHDLIAQGVLSHAVKMGYEVYSEKQIRGDDNDSKKHPDGLMSWRSEDEEENGSIWLEVENSRKSGAVHMKKLAQTLISMANGNPEKEYDFLHDCRIKGVAVAINPEAKDERGYKLDHWKRIEEAIHKVGLKREIQVNVIWIKMAGVGVEDIDPELRTITPRK